MSHQSFAMDFSALNYSGAPPTTTRCSTCACSPYTVANNKVKRNVISVIAGLLWDLRTNCRNPHYDAKYCSTSNIGKIKQAATIELMCSAASTHLVLTSVSPSAVSNQGGAILTLLGTGLETAYWVNFWVDGNAPQTISFYRTDKSDTSLQAIMPSTSPNTSPTTAYITVSNVLKTKESNRIPITITITVN